jgi:hypothetical protein
MIRCQSPLTGEPREIRVPGSSLLTFAAIVVPDAVNPDPFESVADVEYTILDQDCRICFENGRKTTAIRARVTALGNEITLQARFVCCGHGTEPMRIDVTARVRENGVPRCDLMRFSLGITGYDCGPALAADGAEERGDRRGFGAGEEGFEDER